MKPWVISIEELLAFDEKLFFHTVNESNSGDTNNGLIVQVSGDTEREQYEKRIKSLEEKVELLISIIQNKEINTFYAPLSCLYKYLTRQTHYHTIRQLLAAEKQADFEQFKAHVQSLSLQERKKQGFTWYPVTVQKSGYTVGDRAFVVVEKTNAEEHPHQLRAGKIVNFYTLAEGEEDTEKSGIINFVDKHRMKIILNSKDLPYWLNKGRLGVDLLFDERSYLEMDKALVQVTKARNNRLAELRDIIDGKLAPRFLPLPETIKLPEFKCFTK